MVTRTTCLALGAILAMACGGAKATTPPVPATSTTSNVAGAAGLVRDLGHDEAQALCGDLSDELSEAVGPAGMHRYQCRMRAAADGAVADTGKDPAAVCRAEHATCLASPSDAAQFCSGGDSLATMYPGVTVVDLRTCFRDVARELPVWSARPACDFLTGATPADQVPAEARAQVVADRISAHMAQLDELYASPACQKVLADSRSTR